jgi:hypothetical protein
MLVVVEDMEVVTVVVAADFTGDVEVFMVVVVDMLV